MLAFYFKRLRGVFTTRRYTNTRTFTFTFLLITQRWWYSVEDQSLATYSDITDFEMPSSNSIFIYPTYVEGLLFWSRHYLTSNLPDGRPAALELGPGRTRLTHSDIFPIPSLPHFTESESAKSGLDFRARSLLIRLRFKVQQHIWNLKQF